MFDVTLITHSAVLVELDKHSFLFDYTFDGDDFGVYDDVPLLIFVSHGHEDHFSEDIFDIEHPDKHYIISNDIPVEFPSSIVTAMGPGETTTIGDVKVTTLPSNDAGVAYIVEAEGKTIYFAGDLNDWRREDANLKNINPNLIYTVDDGRGNTQKMKGDKLIELIKSNKANNPADHRTMMSYRAQVDKLEGMRLDLACVVVDPRLKSMSFNGLDYFLQKADADHILPIHWFGKYDMSARLKSWLASREDAKDKVLVPTHESETYEF